MANPITSYRPDPEIRAMIEEYAEVYGLTIQAAIDSLIANSYVRWTRLTRETTR